MGHGDVLVICDAGFPIPSEEQRIDLALEQDVPTIEQVLNLVVSDFCYEKVLVAAELKEFNRPLYDNVEKILSRCPVSTMPYAQFMATIPRAAKYIVRTGAFSPYGNIALSSAVDAPKWFSKPGLVVPDVYKDRV